MKNNKTSFTVRDWIIGLVTFVVFFLVAEPISDIWLTINHANYYEAAYGVKVDRKSMLQTRLQYSGVKETCIYNETLREYNSPFFYHPTDEEIGEYLVERTCIPACGEFYYDLDGNVVCKELPISSKTRIRPNIEYYLDCVGYDLILNSETLTPTII